MSGIHHVTAIAGNPPRNFGLLFTGLWACASSRRPSILMISATYHFYYGDETGPPGTILTFFPWERAG